MQRTDCSVIATTPWPDGSRSSSSNCASSRLICRRRHRRRCCRHRRFSVFAVNALALSMGTLNYACSLGRRTSPWSFPLRYSARWLSKWNPYIHPNYNLYLNRKIAAEFLQRTVDKRSRGRQRGWEWRWRLLQKGHHFWRQWLKMVITFWLKTTVTPLVTAPVDTNVSDASGSGEVSGNVQTPLADWPYWSRPSVQSWASVLLFLRAQCGTEHARHLVQHYRCCFCTSNSSSSNSSWAHKLAKIRISRSSGSHFIASLHACTANVVFCRPLQTARDWIRASLVIRSRPINYAGRTSLLTAADQSKNDVRFYARRSACKTVCSIHGGAGKKWQSMFDCNYVKSQPTSIFLRCCNRKWMWKINHAFTYSFFNSVLLMTSSKRHYFVKTFITVGVFFSLFTKYCIALFLT